MRIVPLTLVALAVAVAANASAATTPGPTGLHGFLLRADEPLQTTFHRTPSFAWSPVDGALRYEFQLSTSSTFRDNGILYDNATLLTPVESPPLTLPWITGSPHALYARARAFLQDGATPWSASFGFDVVPPSPPVPLPSAPGLLRWTPVTGADAYEVWLIDAKKMETVRANVLDEREFYTFHQAQSWIGTVRWRVRALRGDTFSYRINGMPAAMHGAWSPIYSSTNPTFTSGQIQLGNTISDVSSNGSTTSQAHELMPGFTWTGNQSLGGKTAELFRVYVFTDKQCLNRVFTGAIVGSPAYAARLAGPLALPASSVDLPAARSGYLGDGVQTGALTYDHELLTPNEQLEDAKPTTVVPGNVPAAADTQPPPDSAGQAAGSSGSSSGSASASTGGTGAIKVTGEVGPPIDLWDTDWPSSGYYWTVVPVDAVGASGTVVASPGVAAGGKIIPLSSTDGFEIGDSVTIGVVPNQDSGKVVSVGATTITIDTAVKFSHIAGDPVQRAIRYIDMELPEDVCAAGRVHRFGIASEPSLTTAQAPFATGLSSNGRLVSAAKTPAFYGQPLVAWTPAFNASVYEVQWSKTRYPFVAETDPRTSVKGWLTFSTSAVLPLAPGTWWYRVRGFDYNLPTGVQQMSWSDPQKLVVSAPKFKVAKPAPPRKFKIVGKKK